MPPTGTSGASSGAGFGETFGDAEDKRRVRERRGVVVLRSLGQRRFQFSLFGMY